MRHLLTPLLMAIAMTAFAGNFFPPNYKEFPFKEGDLLVSQRESGKYAVSKILKIDRIDIRKGQSIGIQNQRFVATEDDYLLIVSAAYGADEFNTFESARDAGIKGKWTVEYGHVPNRAPGAAQGQRRVGNAKVAESELGGYKIWKKAFDEGKAGVF
jgi:hypothetical protein